MSSRSERRSPALETLSAFRSMPNLVFCVCSTLFHDVGLALRAQRTVDAGEQPDQLCTLTPTIDAAHFRADGRGR